MKVLALLTDGFGAGGGIARYNRDLLTAMAESGATVTALPRNAGAIPDLPVNITQLAAQRGRWLWSLTAVTEALRLRPDMIFCGHIFSAPLAAFISRALQKPLWVQAHGIEAWSRRGEAVQRAVERADLVTSVSRYTRRRLLTWCDLAPERIRVLPNTVDAAFKPRPRRADLIKRYELSGHRVVLTVGRMSAAEGYKGHDRVIRALPALTEQCPDVVYLIAGTGDDRARLEALAREAGVVDRVRFAGNIDGDELPDLYALADVFAMPSTGEGFGIAFLEAAATGIAVIGGNRDGSLDALADGAIGRVIDPDNSPALTAALQASLANPQEQNPKAVERFSFEHFSAHVAKLMGQLGLHSPSRRTG